MRNVSALDQNCPHLATPQERERDPMYFACSAAAGQPCAWARRYDDVQNPPFHSERLELSETEAGSDKEPQLSAQMLQEAVLESGLV